MPTNNVVRLPRATAAKAGEQPALSSGLSLFRGVLNEEYLTDLQPWSRAAAIYKQMRQDGTIGALLEAIKAPLLEAPFEIHIPSNSRVDTKNKKFLEDALFDMPSMEWSEHVEDALEFLDYGFAIAEKLPFKDKEGQIRLSGLLPVGQDTLESWGELDNFGHPKSFKQRVPNTGLIAEAPMSKLLHFTFKSRKRNPQGESLLRSLYRAWYFKENLEALEGIGAERDIGNTPVFELGEGHYTDAQISSLEDVGQKIRVDETGYIILPYGVKISPLGSGGKSLDIRRIIEAWQSVIRQRFFVSFIAFGDGTGGSQSLAKETTSFFSIALRSVQIRLLRTWNNDLIPWLFAINNDHTPVALLPKLAWNKPGARSIMAVAQAANTMVGAGLLTPTKNLEIHFREELALPPLQTEDESLRDELIKTKTNPSPGLVNTGGGDNTGKENPGEVVVPESKEDDSNG